MVYSISEGMHQGIVEAYSDGRCLFRSLPIGVNTELQEGEQEEFGLLTDPVLKKQMKLILCGRNLSTICVAMLNN